MKYKAKFKFYDGVFCYGVEEGQIFDDSDRSKISVTISLTDTRFFEPVKTRKFQVEVEEGYVDKLNYLLGIGRHGDNPSVTVTEITEPSWINQYYKSGSFNAHLFSTNELSTIDVEEFKDEYQYGNKLQGVKWIKDRFGKGLKESKELADFIFALSV